MDVTIFLDDKSSITKMLSPSVNSDTFLQSVVKRGGIVLTANNASIDNNLSDESGDQRWIPIHRVKEIRFK